MAMHYGHILFLTTVAGFGIALVALTYPASAEPRDDVMSNAYHCASIPVSRNWLNCYYGAAQPVRAALGLSAAPLSQQELPTPASAERAVIAGEPVRQAVMTAAAECGGSANDRAWLQCYYAAAQPMRIQLGLSQTPAYLPAAQTFGLPPVIPKQRTNRVAAHMQRYAFDALGWFTVTLDNGQVWRQVPGDTSVARWKKTPITYAVVITRGFLGSYNLKIEGLSDIYKVDRVR